MENLLGLLVLPTWGSLIGVVLAGAAYFFLPAHFPRIEIAIGVLVVSLIAGKLFDLLMLSRKK